jgi:hypothetical protein
MNTSDNNRYAVDEFLHTNGWVVVEYKCDIQTLDERISEIFGGGYLINETCVICERHMLPYIRDLIKELQ